RIAGRAADRRVRGVAGRARRGALPDAPAGHARAGRADSAGGGAHAGAVPGCTLARRALLGEPLPAALGRGLLRRAHGTLGVGWCLRGAGGGEALGRDRARGTAPDPLVALGPAPAARRLGRT